MTTMTPEELEIFAEGKTATMKRFLAAEPPNDNGESLLELWEDLYDKDVRSVIVNTVTGPSDEETNRVFPYEKIQAIVGDGGNWKWPRMWQKFDELERRGPAFRAGEALNFEQPNKNPGIVKQNILVVGGGPVGLRQAIELRMGGHNVTIYEKRREVRDADGVLKSLGFTNRINRPHMWPFVRNDLAKLNGKDFMSTAACYPVFTEPDTSSIGIDELQILLMKNALMLGVDFRLGVGYDDSKIVQHGKTAKPTWNVECSVDEIAAKTYGMPAGANVVNFDCLVGCDGPRSTVRDKQAKYFGDIERRKFMDCVGIVANVKKVSRKRLRELGFEYGQEPKDMNRTTMVFRDFFEKIKTEADADLENFIYYKASFHYYIILTPKRANLIKHGLSGRVYNFQAAREGAATTEAQQEKAKLKAYVAGCLKAGGIPVDDQEPNGGFVPVPNDVMAFDFAECWNTKIGMSFSYPPADFNTELHGAWPRSKKLYPYIALGGDALLEPFWPMGLGLKRGWQAVMNICYAIDNLFNKDAFAQKLGKSAEEIPWDEHYAALEEQNGENFEHLNRLRVSEELGKGEYDPKGIVMQQLNKKLKDAEKPCFEVEVDPWTRYATLASDRDKEWAKKFKDSDILHPVVAKAIAKKEYYDKMTTGKEMKYEGKGLVSINGKVVVEEASGYCYKPPPRKSIVTIDAVALARACSDADNTSVKKAPIPLEEVKRKSNAMQSSLLTAVLSRNVDEHVAAQSNSRKAATAAGGTGALADSSTRDEIGHVNNATTDGVAGHTEAMWNRMNGKHLSPAQGAELEHVRNMITALGKSLESYKQAEKDLMMK